MARKDPSSSTLQALAGTRLANSGALMPIVQEAYIAALWAEHYQLDKSSAGWFRVDLSDANDTSVFIAEGRQPVANVPLIYAGGDVDLAAHDDDVAYVWLENSGDHETPVAAIGNANDATGWPAYPHVKLAEVTLASGAITAILDRRPEAIMVDAHALVHYDFAITVQGDTSTPSTVVITLKDLQDQQINAVDYLRVAVCDTGGLATAANATIAAGANTTAELTHEANKDYTFKSHTDGTFTITLTNATAETVTLRIQAARSSRRADFSNTQDVTHAAP